MKDKDSQYSISVQRWMYNVYVWIMYTYDAIKIYGNSKYIFFQNISAPCCVILIFPKSIRNLDHSNQSKYRQPWLWLKYKKGLHNARDDFNWTTWKIISGHCGAVVLWNGPTTLYNWLDFFPRQISIEKVFRYSHCIRCQYTTRETFCVTKSFCGQGC